MGLAAAIAGAAVIGGVATVAGSAIQSGAANKASKTAAKTAADNNALQKSIYDKNVSEIQPFADRGNASGDLLNNFLGVSGDPAKASAALNTYLNSTGYQFTVDQGVKDITSNKAASGALDSGATLKAISDYGQNTARAGALDWVKLLQGQQGTGLSAVEALTGTGQNYANSVSQNNNNAADASANADLIGASNTTNLIKSLAGSFATTLGQSSYAKPGSSGGGGMYSPSYFTNLFGAPA